MSAFLQGARWDPICHPRMTSPSSESPQYNLARCRGIARKEGDAVEPPEKGSEGEGDGGSEAASMRGRSRCRRIAPKPYMIVLHGVNSFFHCATAVLRARAFNLNCRRRSAGDYQPLKIGGSGGVALLVAGLLMVAPGTERLSSRGVRSVLNAFLLMIVLS
ncbi:hypothetical protein B0H12DRAFT_1143225 [Mycena haematopus]|nr:hypothetical protein B0H12DRAFT_1143225 [Mycena haematopus]